MRAHTKKKHGMGRRFAIVIGVAAAGVMALGAQTVMAQTAAEPPGVVEYDTKLMITHEAGTDRAHWHGRVESDRTECMGGRRVILFQQRPGADRKLGVGKSLYKDGFPYGQPAGDIFAWGGGVAPIRGRVYARVSRKVGDGFVCRADRSITIINGRLQDKKQGLIGVAPPPSALPATVR
jgi:hypothetical protein